MKKKLSRQDITKLIFKELKEGMNSDVDISRMEYILLMASLFGDVEIVELLLKNGVNPNVKRGSLSFFVVLFLITEKEIFELFSLDDSLHDFLETLFNLKKNSLSDNKYILELFSNFKKNKYDIAKLFIKYGVDINKEKVETIPLLVSCVTFQDSISKEDEEAVEELNIVERERSLTAINSINFEYIKLAKFLIKNGADVNIKDDDGNTPFYYSRLFNNIPMVKLLCENGADVNIKDDNGNTPLYYFCMTNNIPMVKLLCENGVDVNQVNEDGDTALFGACAKNYVALVQILLNSGADVNIESSRFKITTLGIACIEENIEIVKLLIDAGADINANIFDNDRVNAYTFGHKKKEIKKLLLKNGINTDVDELSTSNIDKNENEDIRELAKEIKQHELKLKQIRLKAKEENILHYKSIKEKTSITEILNSKDTEALKKLLNKGYDVQYVDIISLVKEDYPLEFIELIVERCKDINIQDKDGNTALMVASKMNNLDIINMLLKYSPDINIKNKNNEEAWELTDNNEIISRLLNFEDEVVSNHQPKALVKILTKFSSSEKLRFTNHPWSTNLDYKKFMEDLKSAWEQERNSLKRIAPKLYEEIDKLLFFKEENLSWSSSIIKKDIEEKNFDSENIKKLQEQIKSLIVIKQNDKNFKLLKKFTKLKKELKKDNNFKIKINLNDVKEDKIDKIFTDIQRLEQALKLILSDINENAKEDTQDVVIEANVVDKETMVELKIIHINSTSPKTADALKETINKNGGNFKSIYNCLLSVCDWSIDTVCSDNNRYKIDYLYPQIDNSEPHCTKIDKTPRGFTHILRFYI